MSDCEEISGSYSQEMMVSILLLSSPLFGQETGLLYIWENGTMYISEWKDGKKHGQGTLTTQDGRKEVGVWRESQPWNSIEYDKNGNTIGKWVNGVVQ